MGANTSTLGPAEASVKAAGVRFSEPVTHNGIAANDYSTAKCASVVCPVRPLMGRMSCGQAENATTRSMSARIRT